MIFNQQDRTVTSVIASLNRHTAIVQPSTGPPEPTSEATNTRGLFAGRSGGSAGRPAIERSNEQPQKCWYCGKTGHKQQNCFLRQKVGHQHRNGGRGSRGGRGGRGYGGYGGHANGGIKVNHGNPEAQVHFKRALVAGTDSGADLPAEAWFVDSGASDHLCSNFSIVKDRGKALR